MNPLSVTAFLLSLLHAFFSSAAAATYNATDIILLNCGATSTTTSLDGRKWEAGLLSKYFSLNDQNASFPSNASSINLSVPVVPYFPGVFITGSIFFYSFPVNPGPKFLRLYFYPEIYSSLDMANSFFSVTANTYTLLNNFSPYMTVSSMVPPAASVIKEYVVTVWDNQTLNVTFIPSPGSYAFINAIEVVSVPSSLYLRGSEIPLVSTVPGGLFFALDDTTSLETLYRLNVCGKQIETVEDTGMYRTWSNDLGYLFGSNWTPPIGNIFERLQFTASTPVYTAPEEVYTTSRMMSNDASLNLKASMTWKFPVDAGFYYLLRLHFCGLLREVTGRGQHVFDIFINNQSAYIFTDVFGESGGHGFPIYRDYIAEADNGDQGGDLWLELHPRNSKYVDAFLNGLEIFKLNQSDGNLAGPNPHPISSPALPDLPHRLPASRKSKVTSTISPIVGAIVGSFVLFSLLLSFFVFHRRTKLKDSISSTLKFSTTKTSSLLPSDFCRSFSIAEIKAATQDFNDQFLIGKGGFGNVYRGITDGGSTTVAIKRLNPSSRQGAHEFHTEITMLSKLRYIHLVSLIGYCDDDSEMILVYDFMPCGTLRDHLYETKNPPLSWKRRLEICIGAARGLHYLHTGSKHGIIHRDVKSSTILLDENYVAKVSDFGLSKQGPTSMSQTHVSTVVKGSFGYIDPEYYLLQRLTEKSDVYSFGVVLFEVLSGKPPVIQGLSEEKVGLAQWARSCYQKGRIDEIVDPHLAGQIAPMALQQFSEIAENCVRERGKERPTMNDIVWELENTLQLQETVDKSTNNSNATATDERSSENTANSQSTSVDNSMEKGHPSPTNCQFQAANKDQHGNYQHVYVEATRMKHSKDKVSA